MEVDHGPTLVDNNLLLSTVGIRTQSEGSAIVHNLIAGQLCMWPEPNRFTPYHLPHSTEVAGLSTIFSGDDRYFNNIVLGIGPELNAKAPRYNYGLVGYNDAKLPVWISGNIYYGRAIPYKGEVSKVENHGFNADSKIMEEGNQVYLNIKLEDSNTYPKTQFITTALLVKAKMPNEAFENADGIPLKIDSDFMGNKRSESNPSPGPFENPGKGMIKLKVW